MKARITAIVLAAGKSQRMNSDVQKQYMIIRGKPVLYYSLKAFSDSAVDDIIIVTGKGERELVQKTIVDRYGFHKVKAVIAGGKERYDSAYAGLLACEESDYVLIHDAARPMIGTEVIERAIEGAREYGAVVTGMPSKDTIKIVDEKEYAAETPPRKNLWLVQTPQAFSYSLIREAYDRMRREESEKNRITDDAMVVENYGGARVKLIFGDYLNIKITTVEDILLAEYILEHMETQREEKNRQEKNRTALPDRP